MSDFDVFEARFAAAYRRYLDEAPTEVDTAEVARAAAAHPRGRTIGRPWALRPAPALAWLVLLAFLVAALGAAALFVGSQRPALGFACPAGTNPDKLGPVDQDRPSSRFDSMVFDRDSGKILIAVDGGTWAFDVCSNTWARMATAPFADMTTRLVHDADSDVTVAVAAYERAVWSYALEANTWTRRSSPPWPLVPWVRLVDVPGPAVLAMVPSDPPELWTYDVEADGWHRSAASAFRPPDEWDARFMAYDPSVDRIVAYDPNDCADCEGGDQVILVDPRTGVWSRAAAVTPDVYRSYYEPDGEIAYDESAQQTAVFALSGDRMALVAYDASADRWESLWSSPRALFAQGPDTLASDPGPRLHHWLVFDSVNERILVAGGERDTGGWVAANDVWAFDTATRRWTELLAPSTP